MLAYIAVGNTSAIVDAAFFPFLSRFNWYMHSSGYACGTVCGTMVLMHRLIMNARSRYEVDHVNGNRLDNRQENLRVCLHLHNSRNVSKRKDRKYKGISFDSRDQLWHARITVDGRHYSFCYSRDPEVCAKAWDSAARFHYGAFAKTNFPGSDATPVWNMTTRSKNTRGRTSAYRGVRRTANKKVRWQALYKGKHLGCFPDEQLAAKAYDEAARQDQGTRALVNFPEESEKQGKPRKLWV